MVNDLNILPVPRRRYRQTNMSMTMPAAANELIKAESTHAGAVNLQKLQHPLSRGARGNSGVILSLLFRGFSKGIEGKESISGYRPCKTHSSLGVADAYTSRYEAD